MSLIDNNTFLPGVLTEVQSEYSYGYDSSQFGATDSVIIAGTAFSGPVGVPVAIYNPEHGRYIFGRTYKAGSKKAATLVSAIEDAYQKGCRTIYGIRISGKEASKDFEFNSNSKYKLRVRSLYPTNQAKEFFVVYDNKEGEERIRILKPAERATIVEKMQGIIESDNDTVVLDLKLNQDYGLTKNNPLVDIIQTVNEHNYNNVVRLGIVNEEGIEVTNTDHDARQVLLGALHPGAYFIGRDKNHITPDTKISYHLVKDEKDKPYEGFIDSIYKKLVLNTDINVALPIYSENQKVFANILKDAQVFTVKPFDFLETTGLVDRVYGKNKVDYEEVDISNFEIYKRLGSGFAITAKAERRLGTDGKELTPKIKETPASDVNRIAELRDGIYSMLENMNARYRVLACSNADEKIASKLPRPSDFTVISPVSTEILKGLITVTPKLPEDAPLLSKKYKFRTSKIDEDNKVGSTEEIYDKEIIPAVPFYDAEIKEKPVAGTLVAKKLATDNDLIGFFSIYENEHIEKVNIGGDLDMIIVEEVLYLYDETASNDHALAVKNDSTNTYDEESRSFTRLYKEFDLANADERASKFGDKKYILSENSTRVYVLKLSDDATNPKHVLMLGDIVTMLGENEDETIIFSQSNDYEVNDVVIQSGLLDSFTLEEFAQLLNDSEALRHLFTFEVSDKGLIYKDDYLPDIVIPADLATSTPEISIKDLIDGKAEEAVSLPADREAAYNYNSYIPYKTNDNFVRHLAQHCTYTSLKTAPAHGIIGLATLNNTSLASVAKRIDEGMEMDFDLYAKTPAGRSMLDRNNMPYPIGKNVSVTFAQYPVYTDEGEIIISNGAAGYAGMISVLPLDQSSTNQPIALNDMSYELTNYQLTRLTQKGYITIKQSYTKGLVITDGITMAPVESPFRRLNVTRIIGGVEELIREASEPFIGKQNNQANRNSLHTAIKSNLEKLKGTLIEAYEFKLVVDPKVMKFAYIDIDYNIVPIYEIREIRNRITVKDQL